jgi:hypothetical protein
MCVILLRKEVIVTIWPNRDDNDHVLITTIDVDSQTGERSGRAFSLILQKSMKHWISICYAAGLSLSSKLECKTVWIN